MDPRLPSECLSVSRRFSDDLDVSSSVLFAVWFRVNVFATSYATTHTKLAWRNRKGNFNIIYRKSVDHMTNCMKKFDLCSENLFGNFYR